MLGIVSGTEKYQQCDPTFLMYDPSARLTVTVYKCYRDQMVMNSGSFWQIILQGLIVQSRIQQLEQ